MNDEVFYSLKLVRDLMTVGVLTCPPDAPVSDVARLILEKNIEAMVVLDHEGHGVGIIGREELVAAYGRENVTQLTAGQVMREGVPQVPPDIPLAAAAQLMRDRGWRVAFLMHNAGGIIYPAAVISYNHFLRHLAAQKIDDLRDLGIAAARQAPLEAFKQKQEAARQLRSPYEE